MVLGAVSRGKALGMMISIGKHVFEETETYVADGKILFLKNISLTPWVEKNGSRPIGFSTRW
jgi:hypothetical protein